MKMADLSQPHDLHPTTEEDHLSRLLVAEVEEPFYVSLFETSGTSSTRPSCRLSC